MKQTTVLAATLAGLVALMAVGCAHEPASARDRSAAARASIRRPYSYNDGDPLTFLEQELATARGAPAMITVPAPLLRALVQNERLLRGQCAELNTQLRALKDIDSGDSEAAWK